MFIRFNKPFTKILLIHLFMLFRHCCRCNAIYPSQYDQRMAKHHIFVSYSFCVLMCLLHSISRVKYEYWQTTFLHNRRAAAHTKKAQHVLRREPRRKKKHTSSAQILRVIGRFILLFFCCSILRALMSTNDWNLYAIYWFAYSSRTN